MSFASRRQTRAYATLTSPTGGVNGDDICSAPPTSSAILTSTCCMASFSPSVKRRSKPRGGSNAATSRRQRCLRLQPLPRGTAASDGEHAHPCWLLLLSAGIAAIQWGLRRNRRRRRRNLSAERLRPARRPCLHSRLPPSRGRYSCRLTLGLCSQPQPQDVIQHRGGLGQ